MGRFVTRSLSANVDAAESSAGIDVSDLKNVSCTPVQRVDNGTVTLQVEVSDDGTVWSPLGATAAETDFAAGADAGAAKRALEGGNGMSLPTKLVRLTASAHSGTGEYDLIVAGEKREGFDS